MNFAKECSWKFLNFSWKNCQFFFSVCPVMRAEVLHFASWHMNSDLEISKIRLQVYPNNIENLLKNLSKICPSPSDYNYAWTSFQSFKASFSDFEISLVCIGHFGLLWKRKSLIHCNMRKIYTRSTSASDFLIFKYEYRVFFSTGWDAMSVRIFLYS
jgi:hypothetical protein